MRADPDGVLLGASFAFAGASVLGSVVAIRDQLPGEPLGVSIPLSVPAGLLAGWGAAVAAPWPMPVAAVMAAAAARRREPGPGPGAVCGVSCPDRSRCLACRHCAPSARRALAVLLCAAGAARR
jgi:hypothetical protein